MMKRIIHVLLRRRHFWREATFSEVAELYISRMMRVLALSLSAAFVSIFLYQNGYSLVFIAGYWAAFFALKALLTFGAARYAAMYGPKHGILLANILYIPSMLIYAFVPQLGLAGVVAAGLLQALSTVVYDLCYLIDFSKVKSIDHAGKEIAVMNVVEKCARGISPIAGGIVAYIAGPEATMWLAALLFLFASAPLFKTGEPTLVHVRLRLAGLPWQRLKWGLLARGAVGFDFMMSGQVWLLFVAVVVLGAASNLIYVQIGMLLSVVLFASIVASYAYGKLIDKRRGGELLRYMTIANALVHVWRPFVASPASAAAVNAVNEAVTTGYSMAFMRGMFDEADRTGNRIGYLCMIELATALGAMAAALVFMGCLVIFGLGLGFVVTFMLAAIASLGIMIARFSLYR